VQVPAGVYTLRRIVLLHRFCVFDLLKVKELLEVRQVQRGAKGESSGIEIEGIAARCNCSFGYLNLERRVCREICESHQIREGPDVKSSKGFEGVVLVRIPRLNVKSLRIEQMDEHVNDLPIVLTVHKCSRQDHVGQGMHTE
jgi:hypothetical protein